jgi:hypothetical protein
VRNRNGNSSLTLKQIGNRVFGDALYIYLHENYEPTEDSEQGAVYGFSGNIDGPYTSFEVAIETSNGIEEEVFLPGGLR